ncbi:MAG TPA: sigma-70 family RNA polymerase sigma factor [Longimicrobiales bacterium]
MTEETDEELVAQLRRGIRAAAERLARRHLRACRAVALAVSGEAAAAEDVAQDAFVQAIERIDDCRQPDRFRAWLLQIVRNRARNLVRDRRDARHESVDVVPLYNRSPLPDADAANAELRDRLLTALAKLPGTRREVLLLHDLEGWKHEEIADALALPVGTVRSHLHHARRAMRRELEEMRE